MKTLLLTNEYPPYIYGGAGVHVDYLSRELSKLCKIRVRCFGDQNVIAESLSVTGYGLDNQHYTAPKSLGSVFGALQRCLDFNTAHIDADLVHVHTWYTHFAGILAKLNYGIPLVITTHSLEPLRPWKRDQLGGGYDFSCWVEKTALEMADAVIAVSGETKKDILRLFNVRQNRVHVIHNGIDTDEYHPTQASEKLKPFRLDPSRPYVLFVGRITRQKGIIHLVRAIRHINRDYQIVLCAGAPDTPDIELQMRSQIEKIQKERDGVLWIPQMVDVPTKIALYSHAAVFCCPSIYEPFGIINLEAMACEVPVVASAVGGIKEIVEHGKTGLLVPVRQKKSSPFEPVDPESFSRDLARQINRLLADEPLRRRMGMAGRRRAIDHFSWRSIAKKVFTLYRRVLKHHD